MGAKGNVCSYKGDYSLKIYTNALKSTACEWILLLLLLLDGIFSYLITKFARYCELQLPCLFCSRIDHALGNDKLEYYRDLICCDHSSDLSSLVFCHSHYHLADAHDMCEECLLSFAKKESYQEVYKLLMGKLGEGCLQKPFFNMDSVPGPMSTRCCSCCGKPWRSRPNVLKLVQAPRPATKPDIPLPKSPAGMSLNLQEGLEKRKDRFSASTSPLPGSTDIDSLSHVGYSEVKINSDSESDFPFSDDDDFSTGPRDRKKMKDDILLPRDSKLLPNKQLDNFSGGIFRKPSLIESNIMHGKHEIEPKKGDSISPNLMASNGNLKHEETNWQSIREKVRPTIPECNPLENIPLSTSGPEISPALSADVSERVKMPKKFVDSGLQKLVSDKAPKSKGMQLLSKDKWTETKENGDIQPSSATSNWESIDLNSAMNSKSTEKDGKDGVEDLSPSCRDIKYTEQPGKWDRNGIRSFADPTTSKPSSKVNGHVEEMQMDASSDESPMAPKSPSTGRSHPHESFEGSMSEIEGEPLVDKLKRQVEQDKQTIENLYRELEEERNAAAIAANQAMAMITKLQEEKSALHMEALHYLRMLEEQADYDVDELERANELVAEKEKEIQDLEAELDYFKIKYPEDFADDFGALEQNEDLNDALLSNMENFKLDEA